MKCATCNAELPPSAKFCTACGAVPTPAMPAETQWAAPAPPAAPVQPVSYGGPASHGRSPIPAVEKRFKALRLIAVLVKIASILVAVVAVIGAVGLIVAGAGAASSVRDSSFGSGAPSFLFSGFLGALFALVYGVFLSVSLYASAEMIYLFLGIEENTRATSEMLRTR